MLISLASTWHHLCRLFWLWTCRWLGRPHWCQWLGRPHWCQWLGKICCKNNIEIDMCTKYINMNNHTPSCMPLDSVLEFKFIRMSHGWGKQYWEGYGGKTKGTTSSAGPGVVLHTRPTDPPIHPITHPYTYPKVGVCPQIINLQTELNYLD